MANYNIINIAALHPVSTLDKEDETHNINGKAVADYVALLEDEIKQLKEQLSGYVTHDELEDKKFVSSDDTSMIKIVDTAPDEDDGSDALVFVVKKD